MMGIYQDECDVDVQSILSGTHKDAELLSVLRESGIGLLREFARDDDIQYMRIVSTNIGMIRTYQKRFASAEKAGGE